MSDAITPNDLAKALGLSPRTIRGYLRERWSTGHVHYARWELDEAMAADVRARFAKG